MVYSQNLLCGYCGTKIPEPSTTFGADDIHAACLAMAGMIDILRVSMGGYPSLVAELQRHISALQTGNRSVQRETLATIHGKCNHCYYGDALTNDRDQYGRHMVRLYYVCSKGIKCLDADVV